jgi:hypothetical protein
MPAHIQKNDTPRKSVTAKVITPWWNQGVMTDEGVYAIIALLDAIRVGKSREQENGT